MTARIVVTGATGTVGHLLVQRLAAGAADVRAMSSRPGATVRPPSAPTPTAPIGAAFGRPVAYLPVDDAAARSALQGMGLPEPLRGWMVALNALVREGLGARPTDDVRRLTRQEPGCFEAFVRAHADAWR